MPRQVDFKNGVSPARFVSVRVVLPLALLFSAQSVGVAEEAERPGLSPLSQRVLPWFPEDTESIVAGQSFKMPAEDTRGKRQDLTSTDIPFAEAMAATSLGVLFEMDAKYRQPLAGRKVALALRGNRNYYPATITLPTWQCENCSIILFEKDLGEAEQQLTAMLRADAEATRKFAGRDVFAFPPTKNMKKEIGQPRRREWLGIFVVVLDSQTLLLASSDKYLEELLERIDSKPVRTAIPENLKVWEHVNAQATAWMVLHPQAQIDKTGGEALLDGIAWSVTPDEVRVCYLSGRYQSERIERRVRKLWNQEQLGAPPKIERLNDGAIAVSTSIKNLGPIGDFWIAFCLYHLEAGNIGGDGE
jgi:hypothetical protein